jgi:hypothetical protein
MPAFEKALCCDLLTDPSRHLLRDGVVLDEYAQMFPRVWSEVIRPALTDREGFVPVLIAMYLCLAGVVLILRGRDASEQAHGNGFARAKRYGY